MKTNELPIKNLKTVQKKEEFTGLKKRISQLMPKSMYNLVYVTKEGETKILSNEEFERFQKRFSKVASYFASPDTLQQ